MSPPLGSASQTSLYQECLRKYAFRYICEIQSPTTPSQALGKDVDDNKLQPYLRDGTEIDTETPAGQIAAAGLELLPSPKFEGLEVQKHFVMPSPSGQFQWQGYIDLWLPKRGLPNFDSSCLDNHTDCFFDEEMSRLCGSTSLSRGIPIVVDFKTTKSWHWIKKPDQLLEDPQAQLYATWAMWATGKREVDLVWTYFKTTEPYGARRSHVRVNGEHVAKQFLRLDAIGRQMFELRAKGADLKGDDAMAFALSLPPTPEACDNFGGCPHRHICNLGPTEMVGPTEFVPSNRRLPVLATQETFDLFAQLAPDAGVKVEDLGINPPEKNLPPAPPIGEVTIPEPQAEKPKGTRGRKPKVSNSSEGKTGEQLTAEMEANARPKPVEIVEADNFDAKFDAAFADLGASLKRFLQLVAAK